MRKILLKKLLASLPIFIIIAIYVYNDPFKVLYHYDSYFPKDGIQYVLLDKDFVSTETFINNYDRYQYDSYIFGNSRSMRYRIQDWEKHINSTKCFHFDASGESLIGIEKKIEFLHKRGVHIANAMFIFDDDILKQTTNDEGHIFIMDPKTSGKTPLQFQLVFLKAFLSPDFLMAYIRFIYTDKPHMKPNEWEVFDFEHKQYDRVTNELVDKGWDDAIKSNQDSFYLSRMKIFYKRSDTEKHAERVIGDEQKISLLKIKEIVMADHTNYKIVISPLYNQMKFDTTDLHFLISTFGKDNVYDLSGKNAITDSIYNYYEQSHYRPTVAKRIMDSIYAVH
jgi:hypothetical protein